MATYLITQATGQQSQWVITHLIAAGVKINAVVRDITKIPSILQHSSVKLFEGESTNYATIQAAAQGCKAVFLNTFPIRGLETEQARTIISASKNAGIETIVVSTAANVHQKEYWDDDYVRELGMEWYFASKYDVEQQVRAAGFKSFTILRPVWIIHDFLVPAAYYNVPNLPVKGEIDHAYDQGAKMPYTDCYDVGRYAAAALLDPAKFANEEIDLGNELLTVEEVHGLLAKVSGKPITVRKRTPEEMEAQGKTSIAQSFQLLVSRKPLEHDEGKVKAIQEKFNIPFTSFEEAMTRDRERLLATIPL